MKHIISLGAGVQSSTMALMAAHGEITPMPDCAVFADTKAEPASVYGWLDWLEKQLPYPVHRVTAKRVLQEEVLTMRVTKDGRKFSRSDLPLFTLSSKGVGGMVTHRNCTATFKIKPIMRFVRQEAGITRGQKVPGVTQWIGISLDEATRMKDSRDPWAVNRWPLIELRMKRHDCLRWMEENGYPTPPRSACVFCPFHSDHEWRRLRDEEPESFERAVQFERDLQKAKACSENFASTPYLHRSLVPLGVVDFSTDTERGQLLLWNHECEGMCGI